MGGLKGFEMVGGWVGCEGLLSGFAPDATVTPGGGLFYFLCFDCRTCGLRLKDIWRLGCLGLRGRLPTDR